MILQFNKPMKVGFLNKKVEQFCMDKLGYLPALFTKDLFVEKDPYAAKYTAELHFRSEADKATFVAQFPELL